MHIFLITNSGKLNFITLFLKNNEVQDLKVNQLKLRVQDSCKKDEKLTTNSKAVNDEGIINNAYLDEKL